jgi:hypothetical protein
VIDSLSSLDLDYKQALREDTFKSTLNQMNQIRNNDPNRDSLKKNDDDNNDDSDYDDDKNYNIGLTHNSSFFDEDHSKRQKYNEKRTDLHKLEELVKREEDVSSGSADFNPNASSDFSPDPNSLNDNESYVEKSVDRSVQKGQDCNELGSEFADSLLNAVACLAR